MPSKFETERSLTYVVEAIELFNKHDERPHKLVDDSILVVKRSII